jgi:ABC-2 type transport system ATP-binding protein
MPPVLAFHEVSKRFRQPPGKLALDQLTLDIEPGEIVGFLGPNGAGKTTALHLALGFLKSTSGFGTIFGQPFGAASARRKLGFLPDRPVFFPGNAETAVSIAATFSSARVSKATIRASLETVGLAEARGDVRKFSRGMQQRLALAQALIHQPQLLLLDEPISALDPLSTLEVLELFKKLRDQGVAILLSSHQLEAIATIADRVVLLDRGRQLLSGRTNELLQGNGYQLTFENLPATTRLPSANITRDGARAIYHDADNNPRAVIQQAWAEGATLVDLRRTAETLTELFLRMTTSAGREKSQ